MTAFGARTRLGAIVGLTATLAAGSLAAAPAPAQLSATGRAQVLQSLSDCRKLTADAARLACYDQAAAGLEQAEAKGDIVVVDREQARKVRRQAFGFSLPSLSMFEKGEKPEEIDTIAGQVATARMTPAGKWIIKLEDGATWMQVDSTQVVFPPKPGAPVKIRKASLGSYLLTVGNQRAFRAHRQE